LSNISISPAFPTYWCYLDIFGRPCPGTEFLQGYIQAEKLIGYQKMMDLKKAENAWLKEKFYTASTNNFKWLSEMSSIKDMMNINITPQNAQQGQTVGPVRTE
jgi:hypothetical protein